MAPVIGRSAAPVLVEGCCLPLEPVLGHPRSAAQSRRVEQHTTTSGSRQEQRERRHRHRNAHDVKQRSMEKPNGQPGIPPRSDQSPGDDPAGHAPRAGHRLDGREQPELAHRVPNDAPSGATLNSATQTQSHGHSRTGPDPGTTSTGRPSGRVAERRRPARKQSSHAIGEPDRRPGSGQRWTRRRRA